MIKTLVRLSFVLVLLLTTIAHATTVERLNLDDLVKKAHRIVYGRVTNSQTRWSDDRKLILTTYTLDVRETMKGQATRTVELTAVGGQIGDLILHVSGMPSFEKGEEAVVFIEDTGPYSTLVGLGQGKFTVTNGEVSNNVGDLAFPDGRPGRPLRMPIDGFRSEIKRRLER